MAKKKKRKSRPLGHGFENDGTGHHARLRKLRAGRSGRSDEGPQPRRTSRKGGKRRSEATKRSALMKRLHTAVAGAREQIRSFGRRQKEQPQKLVTEETLRNHMALKCVRRCSH